MAAVCTKLISPHLSLFQCDSPSLGPGIESVVMNQAMIRIFPYAIWKANQELFTFKRLSFCHTSFSLSPCLASSSTQYAEM